MKSNEIFEKMKRSQSKLERPPEQEQGAELFWELFFVS